MPILVKCNASDLLSSEPFSVTMLAEKQTKSAEGDEVFVWTSELPRQGPRGIGLEARGYLSTWRRSGAKVTVSVRIIDRSPKTSLGMQHLARLGRENAAAQHLYERIHKFRPRRIWALTNDEVEFLTDAFESGQPDDRTLSEIDQIRRDTTLSETTKKTLVDARLGQGRFRRGLEQRWGNACAVTGCLTSAVLRASHIKPWRLSTNSERLDPENGLLLAAHIDALFDFGLISFDNDGSMLISDQICADDTKLLRLEGGLRITLTERERNYLSHHRATSSALNKRA